MPINYSPSVVTSGLVLCLDAANVKSYPGSGTTWTDLSGNGYDATLSVESIGTTTDNVMTISGNNISIPHDTNLNFSNTNFSVCSWAKYTTGVNYGFIKKYGNTVWSTSITSTGQMQYRLSDGVWMTTQNSTNTIDSDTWYYLVWSFDVSGNLNAYANGELIWTRGISSVGDIGSNNTAILYIGSSGYAGIFATTQLYDKALSQSEITQNFNAHRSRYNI